MATSTQTQDLSSFLIGAGLAGVGQATVAAALDEAEITAEARKAEPNDDQRSRAKDALEGNAKAGLRGKALALWVLTGKSTGKPSTPAPRGAKADGSSKRQAKPQAEKPAGFEWPEAPDKLLLAYLRERVSGDHDAPLRSLPFINPAGKLFVHSRWFIEWLKDERKIDAPASEVQKALREQGLAPKPFAIPDGSGKSWGLYQGPAPKGTDRLQRREQRTGGGGGAKPAPSERADQLASELIAHAGRKLKDASEDERGWVARKLARELVK